jgi:hypothetical protein
MLFVSCGKNPVLFGDKTEVKNGLLNGKGRGPLPGVLGRRLFGR